MHCKGRQCSGVVLVMAELVEKGVAMAVVKFVWCSSSGDAGGGVVNRDKGEEEAIMLRMLSVRFGAGRGEDFAPHTAPHAGPGHVN